MKYIWTALCMIATGFIVGYSWNSQQYTPTIGTVCKNVVVSGDITYFRDNMICATMYAVHRKDEFDGWYYIYIIGTHAEAVFKTSEDAMEWVKSQPYIRRATQVR